MNLIICISAFQLMLAENIINNSNDEFFLIAILGEESSTSKFYAEKVKKLCSGSIILFGQQTTFIPLFSRLLVFCIKSKKININNLYFSSVDTLPVQFLCSRFAMSKFYTFDDGLANLVLENGVFSKSDLNFKDKIKRILLNVKFSMEDIKLKSQNHYTIYPKNENIIKSPKKILEFVRPTKRNKYTFEKNILIGQYLYDSDEEMDNLVNSVLQETKIDYYIPHPRSKYRSKKIKNIEMNLLIEDYISENQDTFFNVYGFFSSSLVNLSNFSNVNVKSIYSKQIPIKFIKAYEVLKDFNIEIVSIDT